MWNYFYRNQRLLLLALCSIVVWGLTSYAALPRMEDPVPAQRSALVSTRFPGASAQRVEALVTDRIETALLELEEVDTLRSTSQAGSSVIIVELKTDIVDVDRVWSRVRDRLADVAPQLPDGASASVYEDLEPRASGQIVALTWTLNTPANAAILSRLAEELSDRLQILRDTASIEIVGAPNEEIAVGIRPYQLADLGLSIREVAEQIQASDAKVAAGQVRDGRNDLPIELESELDSLERVRKIPIRSGTTSQFTRLGDIAWVEKSVEEPPSEVALVAGNPSIVLALLSDSDRRIDLWSQRVRQVLADYRQQLPPGVELVTLFDQANYVNDRLESLFSNLFLGALCVVVSTTLLMGWRAALIVGVALPLSVLMVFAGLRLCGIPLHQMSLTGLVVALGLLIDNAIVVVDEVKYELDGGTPAAKAVATGARTLSIPLLASTLTTVLTFMPSTLIPGETREFIGPLATSVILALSCSLFLSLTIIPALAGRQCRTARSRSEATKLRWWQEGLAVPQLARRYGRSLDWVLAKPLWGIGLAIVLPCGGFLSAFTLDAQLFPPADRDQFQIELELSPQASLAQMEATALAARDVMLERDEIRDVYWFVGRSAPSFYYNMPRGRRNSANYAHGVVQATSPRGVQALVRSLQGELENRFPTARVSVRQFEQGPTIRAPIQLRLHGPDLDELRVLGRALRAHLAGVTEITSTSASLVDSSPKLALRLDEEQARLAGLDNRDVAEQLDANLEGVVGGSIFEGTEEIPVRVRLSNSNRGSLERVASTELLPLNGSGETARNPLSLVALGEIDLVPEYASISRRNGQRTNEVNGFIVPGALPANVLQTILARLEAADWQLPVGYTLEIGGEAAERGSTVSSFLSTAGVLLVVVATVLVLSLGSFRAAGAVALVGFLAVGLGLLSLRLWGYPLGFMAILGIASLIGVSINDSIVVLAALRQHPQAARGDRQAIRETVMRSTRHVLATTLTTVTGFAPLLIAGGDFWPPMAVCIAFGVFGATLLALYLIPCTHLLLLRWRRKPDRQAEFA